MNKMNPVVHFEMSYNDRDRMIKFYESTFGWQTKTYGPDMGNYVVAYTSESDTTNGRPKNPGSINGGFYQKMGPSSQAPSIVIAVENINAAVEAVKANGGKILGAMGSDGQNHMEPQDIPGVGLWISAMDPEDNRFSILQPKGM